MGNDENGSRYYRLEDDEDQNQLEPETNLGETQKKEVRLLTTQNNNKVPYYFNFIS